MIKIYLPPQREGDQSTKPHAGHLPAVGFCAEQKSQQYSQQWNLDVPDNLKKVKSEK